MSSKKFMNDPSSIVDESLEGFVATHFGTSLLAEHRVVYRSDIEIVKQKQVAVICGGGSGHEPAHVGYVGKGMLSAAVCGDVFASPAARAVHAAIRLCAGPAGVLLVQKNYTGDNLHFAMAAHRARAEGIAVKTVVVGEDVAMPRTTKSAGRRGLCGTVLVYKIAGALAEEGASLDDIAATCVQVANNMGSLNVALTGCCAPGKEPSFDITREMLELGLGIHGEAGYQRIKLNDAAPLVKNMLDLMLSTDSDRKYLEIGEGDQVVLAVNNLGATTNMELSVVAREALKHLATRHISVQRCYCATMMTALDMAGVSLTLLKASDSHVRLLDAPTAAAAWPTEANHMPGFSSINRSKMVHHADSDAAKTTGPQLEPVKNALLAACKALEEAEPIITQYDITVGDGDCGTTLQAGARAVQAAIEKNELSLDDASKALRDVSNVLEDTMGGTSGALYCIGLDAAATAMLGHDPLSPATWANALKHATQAIMEVGAKGGERTMVDALLPACDVLAHDVKDFPNAASAADKGAQATSKMEAHAGRTSYVNKDQYMGTPDPGAVAVAYWLRAIVSVLY